MNCLLVGNTAEDGGGAYECELEGCTLTDNRAGVSGGGAYLNQWGSAVNTLAARNTCTHGAAYGNDVWCQGAGRTLACLTGVDAKFVDAANGDWRLTARSPAIDAGTNDAVRTIADLDGTNRIYGARVDIGCYEYCHEPEGWPVPAVEPGASAAEEAAAVSAAMTQAGFPAETAAAVTTAADYAKVTGWAEANGVSAAEQAASPTAILSPALDADGLVKIGSNELQIAALTLSTNAVAGTVLRMTLPLEAYDAAKADERLLKAAVGVVGAEDLADEFTADDLSVEVSKGADAVEISVTPPAAAPTYFLRTKVR